METEDPQHQQYGLCSGDPEISYIVSSVFTGVEARGIGIGEDILFSFRKYQGKNYTVFIISVVPNSLFSLSYTQSDIISAFFSMLDALNSFIFSLKKLISEG